MRRLVVLAPVLAFVAGCGGSSGGWSTYPTYPNVAQYTNPAADVPVWVRREHLPPRARAGARLFAVAGCTVCHTYAGSGERHLRAPDLTAIGSRGRGIRYQIAHLECPSCVHPGSQMPPFAALGKKRLREIAIFLEASKGAR